MESTTDTELDVGQAAAVETEHHAAPDSGIFAELGALPAGAMITEDGLARIFGKCKASIKAAVERNEFPRPSRLMGKNTWTAGAIIRHHEERMEADARRLRVKP